MHPWTGLELIVDIEIPTLVASRGGWAGFAGKFSIKSRAYKLAHSKFSESRTNSSKLWNEPFADIADARTIKPGPAASRDQIGRWEAHL